MHKNKSILIVTSEFPPQPGGIGNHAFNLAKYLEINAYNVNVIADQRSDYGNEERVFDKGLKFNIIRIRKYDFRWIMYFKRILLIRNLIKSSNTVIASGKFSLWIVAFYSLFFERNYIAVLHGSEVNFNNYILNKSIHISLKRFSKLIAVSNYTKSLVSKHKNIEVIPNGFDSVSWASLHSDSIYLEGDPKLITVGNVTDRKGQLNVINHLPELIKKYKNIHYHCVGIPTQKDDFLKKAIDLKVENHLTFHGQVTERELKQLLLASDIFVMLSSPTSTGDVEGFGIAVIEANYLGRPSIGAKDCGIEDAIDNYKSGVLVPYNNSLEFIKAIDTILSNFEFYNKNAREWAKKHTWYIIVEKYIKVIES